MKLYKYLKVSDRNFENLRQSELFFSRAADFNDPFDCGTIPDPGIPTRADLLALKEFSAEIFAEALSDGGCSPCDLEKVQSLADDELQRIYLDCFINSAIFMSDRLRDERGVACFSESDRIPLMWGHYSDGHRGYCLEFDTSVTPFNRAGKVKYLNNPKRISLGDFVKRRALAFEGLFLAKHKCWRHEKSGGS
jgi:hypothetical protein